MMGGHFMLAISLQVLAIFCIKRTAVLQCCLFIAHKAKPKMFMPYIIVAIVFGRS